MSRTQRVAGLERIHVPSHSTPPPARPRTGLAVACLVLGVLAVVSSIFVVGALAGLLAIPLGVFHISKRRGPNGMAWAGIGLSLTGIILSVGLAALYVKLIHVARNGWSERMHVESIETVETSGDYADWVGREVPDLTLTTLSGERLRIRDLRGRRLILDFWATWCPPCRREIPHFVRLTREHSGDELRIIGISSEDEETLRAYVDEEGVNYAIVSEDQLPPPFDSILAIPTTFFIDRNGRIQEVAVGYHDYDQLSEWALAADLPDESGAPPTGAP